jgi:hypothetical protein
MLHQTSKGKVFFPERLFGMLESAVSNGFDHVVSWTEDGEAFIVRDTALFEKQVLTRYFDHSSIRSFTRQLSYWSIRRVSKSQNSLTFQHTSLRQGQRRLIKSIIRKEHKGHRVRRNGVTINLKQCKDEDSTESVLSALLKYQDSRSRTAKSVFSAQSRTGADTDTKVVQQLHFALQNGDISSTLHQEVLKRLVGQLQSTKSNEETAVIPEEKKAFVASEGHALEEEPFHSNLMHSLGCELGFDVSAEYGRGAVTEQNSQLYRLTEPATISPSQPRIKPSQDMELPTLAIFGDDEYITSDLTNNPYVSHLEPMPFRENNDTGEVVAQEIRGNNIAGGKYMAEDENMSPVLLDMFPMFDYNHHDNGFGSNVAEV